jgi:DNA-binding MarR family transcriptional regulator
VAKGGASAQLDSVVLVAWRNVQDASDIVRSRVADELESATGLPLEWYSLLLHIYETGHGSMAQNALSEHSRLSQSGISRAVSRMEAEGLVSRAAAAHDRRNVQIELTAKGRDVFLRATPVHNAAVARHFGDRIGAKDVTQISSSLRRITNDATDGQAEDAAHQRLDQLVSFGESLLAITSDVMAVADAIRVRDALELPLLADVARNLPTSAVAELRAAVARMATALGSPEGFFRADWDLHRSLAQHCRNTLLRGIYLRLLDIISNRAAAVEPTNNLPEYLSKRLAIHALMVEAVVSGDIAAVESAAHEHHFTSSNGALIDSVTQL